MLKSKKGRETKKGQGSRPTLLVFLVYLWFNNVPT